jgi:hypothetical protein
MAWQILPGITENFVFFISILLKHPDIYMRININITNSAISLNPIIQIHPLR